MPDHQTWIVTCTGQRPVADVATDLSEAGFTIGSVLDAIGVITGTAPESRLAAVRAVPGVADVAADQPVDIGPPDASTTW